MNLLHSYYENNERYIYTNCLLEYLYEKCNINIMIIIKLNKKEAERFFGNMSRISEILSIQPSAVSHWPEQVPQGPAWALDYIAKSVKYKKVRLKKGKLYTEIKIK